MQFFSRGAYRNPMVVRVAGLAYQEGFGGHFHNDNSVAVLRDIPGLVLAVPARADDAAPHAAHLPRGGRRRRQRLRVPGADRALPHPRPVHRGRRRVAGPVPRARRPGPARTSRSAAPGSTPWAPAEDLTIITFGNGVRMSLRAAARLADEGIGARVVDLRWLAPLPVADMIREASATGRVLVVDETRRSGGVGEGVLAALVDAGYVGSARRIAAVDSFVPLGPAARAGSGRRGCDHRGCPGPAGAVNSRAADKSGHSVRHLRDWRDELCGLREYVDELEEARRQ